MSLAICQACAWAINNHPTYSVLTTYCDAIYVAVDRSLGSNPGELRSRGNYASFLLFPALPALLSRCRRAALAPYILVYRGSIQPTIFVLAAETRFAAMTEQDNSYRPRSPDFTSLQPSIPSQPVYQFGNPLSHRASYDASPFFTPHHQPSVASARASQQYIPPYPDNGFESDMARRSSRLARADEAEPVPEPKYMEPVEPEESPEYVEPPKVDPAGGIEVRTKFPVARIKRIMQADEDVGKVAQVTPIAVCMYQPLSLYPCYVRLICFSYSESSRALYDIPRHESRQRSQRQELEARDCISSQTGRRERRGTRLSSGHYRQDPRSTNKSEARGRWQRSKRTAETEAWWAAAQR